MLVNGHVSDVDVALVRVVPFRKTELYGIVFYICFIIKMKKHEQTNLTENYRASGLISLVFIQVRKRFLYTYISFKGI